MKAIAVTSNPNEAVLKDLGTAYWPTWEKEVSTFSWAFVTTETALIEAGECVMTPEDGSPAVTFKAGDLVVFPNGFKGTWEVKKPLKKRFKHIDGNFTKCFFCGLKILSNRIKAIGK
ncbi:MAG: putative cupin superfamily protein [Methylophilaceae bacterium]|jgi:uncharacterized cupin superfamily protein|tara:strand:+ start:17967 stop:18317 length:351 start_codon:yes stop_codon:yes gene_type:complete